MISPVLFFFVCFGMVCVFMTFGFMMPIVAHVVGGIFAVVMGEQAMAMMRGVESGCVSPEDRQS